MADFDVAVIGGGIAGAAAAWALSARRSVLLLEGEDRPGYHSTGRSVAILSRTYGSPQVRALTAASLPFLRSPPRDFTDHPLLGPRGLLFVAGRGEAARLDAHEMKSVAGGVPVDRLTAARVAAMVPVFDPTSIDGGLLEPGAADIDVAALHHGFLRAARHAGAEVATSARVDALQWAGNGWRIAAGDRQYRAAVVVNAAGAWADEVAALAGLPGCDIRPLARTVATFDAPMAVEAIGWPMVMDAGHRFYFKPAGGGLLASLSDEQPSLAGDVQAEELHLAELMHHLEQATSLRPRRLRSRWAGLRSFAPDRDLVCGRDPLRASFFWFAGQGGFGIQTAPAAATLLASLIEGERLPETLDEAGIVAEALSPARFGRG